MMTHYPPATMTDTEIDTEPAVETIEFEDGIPGFPDARHFVIVELVEDGAFQMLQNVEDPDLALVVGVPWLFFPEYSPMLTDVDQAGLGIEKQEDAVVFCAVTIDAEARSAHMNLIGPFIVNINSRQGRQVVLADQDFPLRAPIPLNVS